MNKIDIKKTIPPVIHIVFCAAIFIFPLLVMSRYGIADSKYYTGYLIRTGILIVLFYINYLFLIDKLLFKKQFVPYIIINVVIIGGIILLQNFIFELLIGPPPTSEIRKQEGTPRPPYELRILGDYILIIFVIGMSVALKATKRWYKDSINLEA
ncbi:MAG TPA: hypothetical protein DIT04_07095, partial [Dysgonomonas sp.]|nr:hypothetical protein [Dysgonomonas sp.]